MTTHQQTFLVTVTSSKPIADLAAKLSNRMWTMDTVTNVETRVARVVANDGHSMLDKPLQLLCAVEREVN